MALPYLVEEETKDLGGELVRCSRTTHRFIQDYKPNGEPYKTCPACRVHGSEWALEHPEAYKEVLRKYKQHS